jgi:GT2 family glycosyltransferase
MKVLFICVNYFNDDETRLFAESVLALPRDCDLQVIIVDNSASFIVDGMPLNCSVHRPSQNLGYFGAASWALDNYLERSNEIPDFVIVANTDIEFEGQGFFEQLRKFSEVPDVGVIAPSVISDTYHLDQNPYMLHEPSKVYALTRMWIFQYPLCFSVFQRLASLKKKIKRLVERDAPIKTDCCCIYAPHGSFVVFTRVYFELGGSLSHPFFLYGEEIFVANTVKRLGLRVLYAPSLRLLHREHSTTSKIDMQTKSKHAYQSAKYLYAVLRTDDVR